ncbi:MAG: RDD family protein [Thermoleophilia bacterium]|nr:RDD family protein [Thermoleophilia bacterium]
MSGAELQLDAVDLELEQAIARGDRDALGRLADRLEAQAEANGGSHGLLVAAARARAALARIAPAAPTVTYAGWGRRVAGSLIDWTVIWVAVGIAVAVAPAVTVPSYVLPYVVPFVYFTVLHGASGRTLGKAALGMTLRRVDGGPVGYAAAAGRTVTQFLLFVLVLGFVIDSLWPLWSDKRRTLHDKAAGTVVVRNS